MSTLASGLVEKDPERLLKFKECCDLLLIGGYFRARIAVLSAFDRVIGGIAWSLAASGAETGDIDVIFTENASIGQRIRMSDQLVAALLAAKCPHRLQSHQIQGLDYEHLFPVIQWLVRSVLEVRRLTGDITRQQSMRQFKSHHRDHLRPSGEAFIADVSVSYRPHRLFKQKAGASFGTIQRRADATLLEFGATINRTQFDADTQSQSTASNSKVSQARDKVGAAMGVAPAQSASAAAAASDAAMYNELAAQLADLGAASGRVSGASVGAIVGMQSDEIKRAIDEYNENKRRSQEEQDALAKQGNRGAEAAYARQVETMHSRIAALQEQIAAKAPAHEAAQARLAELESGVSEQEAYAARCRRESAKLDALEAEAGNAQVLHKLQSLVALNEQLTRQEETFKQSCIASRASLLAELESIETAASNTASVDVARMLQIEKVFESETAKLAKLRVLLARRNQVLSKLVRAIDDRPSRAELLQYEKRFAELSSLVHEKLGETRKYYAMYNTLSDSLSMMQAEKQLFDELINQFPAAAKSKAGKLQLVDRLASIVTGIKQQAEAKSQAFGNARAEADSIAAKHAACNEKQRDYAKLLREFKEECDRNDQLLASVQSTAQAS